MSSSPFRAPFVEALAARVRRALAEGKLDDDHVDHALSGPARVWVEGTCEATQSTPLGDVETLVELLSVQLGGEAALAELADGVVADWIARGPVGGLVRAGLSHVDGAGLVASQASEWLVVAPDWIYEGGKETFALRLRGLSAASPALRALLGALLARLATAGSRRPFDIRVCGVDDAELVIEGNALPSRGLDPLEEVRLHRAALAG